MSRKSDEVDHWRMLGAFGGVVVAIALISLVVLGGVGYLGYSYVEQQQQLEDQQETIEQFKQENARLEQQNAELRDEKQQLESNLETLQDEEQQLKQNNSEIQSENAHLRQENRELSSWIEKIADEETGEVKQSAGTPWGGGNHVKVTEGYCVDQEFCRMTITTNDYAEFVRNNSSRETITVEFEYGSDITENISIRRYSLTNDGEVYIYEDDVFIYHSQYEDESKYDSNLAISYGYFGDTGINFDSKDEENRQQAGDEDES